MILEVKKFNELTNLELYEILKIRSEIFVVEQNCVYNDLDEKDLEAIHFMIKENNKIISYLRVLKNGVSYDGTASFGRVLVVENFRNQGLARKIVKAGINYIINELKENKITIGAQEYLKSFYESLGFVGISEVYLEDGIPHLDMIYEKNN
jgi:ElaA protein